MKIYLMRHGHALSATEAGVKTDRERPLSDRGRAEARKAAEHLKAKGARPALILCSPLLRARQTAEELAAAVGGPEVRPYAPLENVLPGAEVARLAAQTDWGVQEVLLVGHMPQISEAAAHFIDSIMTFAPAEIAAFEVGAKAAAPSGERRTAAPSGGGVPKAAALLWRASPAD
ncbi:MAG: phosphohistidine phosphatase SixA [Elusimicrobia bacterium]|nr:phosphohistidine phosphatase SixA [Elusimicrobiota bacterium]